MLRRRATALKLLVVSDVDGRVARVNQLCEAVVCSPDCDVDAVLVCGGLVGPRAPHAYEALEVVGCAEGDMTAVISRLEMVISHVVYIPSENDPPTTRSLAVAPPALTQYSVNVYSKAEPLAPGVSAMGEAHYLTIPDGGLDGEVALVLRDSSVGSRLPVHTVSPPSTLLGRAGTLIVRALSGQDDLYTDDPRVIEVVGGRDQDPRVEASRIFVGSLCLGQYAILELEKSSVDEVWVVRSTAFRQLPELDDRAYHS